MTIIRKIGVGMASVALLISATGPANAATAGAESATARPRCAATAPKKITTGSTAWVPAAKTRGSIDCWLAYDLAGYNSATYRLQESLKAAEGKAITVDGCFGQATKTAVLQVQARYGLIQDGIYGPSTGGAMKWRGSNGSIGKWL
ncbi:peptidoglycan-binding domain-containing protein [Actinomyces urogenitalis]|uniref:peptidoglycan-binding domain-containing protein n=1 Tax=Actinomyces urogenitalis TaxID=103621 RepID=UPI00242D7228|nr:peptidoglycan-binding domain-containing protein [Actinomyces urogenitalis]MCI7457247.1 peptidoglycan-binding protein [Actinomyces urogenitalis]